MSSSISTMLGTLVETTTADGIRLHGFVALPPDHQYPWLMVHGVNSNFYSSSLLQELANALYQRGHGVALVNTRGHDILSYNSGNSPVRIGSQIEVLSHCQLDIRAWETKLRSMTNGDVCLLGHSLGAIKSLFYLSTERSAIARWIAVSPPRLNTDNLLCDPKRGDVFRDYLDQATEWCNNGKHDHVMKVRFPMPMWICAATYVDKYGSRDKFDYIRLASSIIQPGLWSFGQVEVQASSASFFGANRIVQSQIKAGFFVAQQLVVIDGADHSYRGQRENLAQAILDWLERNP